MVDLPPAWRAVEQHGPRSTPLKEGTHPRPDLPGARAVLRVGRWCGPQRDAVAPPTRRQQRHAPPVGAPDLVADEGERGDRVTLGEERPVVVLGAHVDQHGLPVDLEVRPLVGLLHHERQQRIACDLVQFVVELHAVPLRRDRGQVLVQ